MDSDRARSDALRALRDEWNLTVEPHRPALHRYCRHLCGDPFTAEDLHQETVTRTFAWLAERFEPLRRPRAFLFRAATRIWLDERARRRPELSDTPEDWLDPAAPPPLPSELADAMAVVASLPPREASAFLLRDVFGFDAREAAHVLGATEAATAVAVVRARSRLRTLRPEAPTPRLRPQALDALVAALVAKDIDAVRAVLHPEARGRALGCAREEGVDELLRGTLFYLLHRDDVVRAEVTSLDGRWLALWWYRTPDGGEAVSDVTTVEVDDEGAIVEVTLHWFCPALLTEVGDRLGVRVVTHGHGRPAGATWWNVPEPAPAPVGA